jgi:hypothetical protein
MSRRELLAVRQDHVETARVDFHALHRPFVYIRDSALLEPKAVVDEPLEWNRFPNVISISTAIFVNGKFAPRIGNVRSSQIRSQTHADRHVVLPECHGLTKNPRFHFCRA